MKARSRLSLCALVCAVIAGCESSGHRQARELAAQIESTMAATRPGAPGSKDVGRPMPEGCYLRATINGKRWEATAMTPDLDRSSLTVVHGRNENSFMEFHISARNTNVGKTRQLGDARAVSYWDENNDTWSARSGSITVQKADEHFVEGTFNFTAGENGKYCVCTDGQFRILAPPQRSAN